MKKSVLFLGGYGISRRSHRDFNAALDQQGYEIESFTMAEASKLPNLADLVEDKTIITHSLTLLLVDNKMRPKRLIAVNPPEPQGVFITIARILKKSTYHAFHGNLRDVIGSTGELARHCGFYFRHLKSVREFSASEHLPEFAEANPKTEVIMLIAESDEVYDTDMHDLNKLKQAGVEIKYHDSMHDSIYAHPEKVLRSIEN